MAPATKNQSPRGCKADRTAIFFALFWVTYLSILPGAEAQQDQRAHDPAVHLKQAKRLTNLKKYKDALSEVNKALTDNPNYWQAWYQGAYIFQLQGRRKEAIYRYRRLLDRKPDFLEARINLGSLYRHEGKLPEAEREYRKVLEANFYNVDAHYNLANILIDEDKLEDAIKELRFCIKQAPTNAWAHNNLGVIFQRGNYLDEAADEFQQAANLEPANKRFFDNLQMVRGELNAKKFGDEKSGLPVPGDDQIPGEATPDDNKPELQPKAIPDIKPTIDKTGWLPN